MYGINTGNRNFRKRKQDRQVYATEISELDLEDQPLRNTNGDNVVESSKVKQYLGRLLNQDDDNPSACIKLVLSESESAILTTDSRDSLVTDFGISSIHISECMPQSVDRIVTIHGNLKEVSRCTLFIAFVMNSDANNILKLEAYTLKSQNYSVDVLVEANDLAIDRLLKKFPSNSIDIGPYEQNFDLHLATLRGDFVSLSNSLIFIFEKFPYHKYAPDNTIKTLPTIKVHDGDILFPKSDVERRSEEMKNAAILNYIYNMSYISGDEK